MGKKPKTEKFELSVDELPSLLDPPAVYMDHLLEDKDLSGLAGDNEFEQMTLMGVAMAESFLQRKGYLLITSGQKKLLEIGVRFGLGVAAKMFLNEESSHSA